MNKEQNTPAWKVRFQEIARFEAELCKVQRPGVDKLMEYIRKSDFYTAPASTKFHLSCPGGLLRHSLNVLDALRGILIKENDGQREDGTPILKYHYAVAGQVVATVPEESVTIIALLHDICKTYFYSVSTRNVKNKQTGQWEEQPFYTVEDKMPLGHGAKSAMIIKEYMELTTPEMYAIWWHMGPEENALQFNQAVEKFPIILALHLADMMASRFMEDKLENKPAFIGADEPGEAQEAAAKNSGLSCPPSENRNEAGNSSEENGAPEFEEAPPISVEA